MKRLVFFFIFCLPLAAFSQGLQWQTVDSSFGPLPGGLHVYFTDQKVDTAPFRAYYVEAELKNRKLVFTTDTSHKRRLTPSQFYEKNEQPLIVVNGTFFSFEQNKNLNLVIRDSKLISFNQQSLPGRGKDTLTYRHPFASAIGITKTRKADVAWTVTDSSTKHAHAFQNSQLPRKDSVANHTVTEYANLNKIITGHDGKSASFLRKWKMKTAIGGGPVLVQNGEIKITNNEEIKFTGKAIYDKHPRTAMGYTKDGRLIILVVEGRNPQAGGASLTQLAAIMKDLGCDEALNLDGGGSSCLLINGKSTIRPSDKEGQRPVPAVFIIKAR